MEGDHLGAGGAAVERHQLDPAPIIDHRIVGDDAHAQSGAPAGHDVADAAQADYPQHRAGESPRRRRRSSRSPPVRCG